MHTCVHFSGLQHLDARKANETGKLYEEDIAEIEKMHNEQTKFLKKTLEAVMYLYEEDSKKKK